MTQLVEASRSVVAPGKTPRSIAQTVKYPNRSRSVVRLSSVVAAALFAFLLTGLAIAADVVNMNKADAAAMQQNLIGIGPIKAEAIVSYRKKNGKFKDVGDLLNVKGIGPALLKKNKRYLSLSKGAVSGDAKKYAVAKKQAKAKQTGASGSRESAGKSTGKKSSAKSSSLNTKSGSTASAAKSKPTGKSKSKSTAKSKNSTGSAKKSKPAKSSKKSSKKSTKKTKKKCDPKKDKNCKAKAKKAKKKASTT